MANSLMELYGGGLLGPSNNYQLGGRIPKYPLGGQIAASRRGRQHQVELKTLRRQAERDAERRGLLGKVSSVVKFGGNLIAPGFGDIVGTAIESSYKPQDYGKGKYTQGLRDEMTQQSKDYKSGIFERGVVGGLQSMLMPEVYSGVKEEFGKGLDYLKGLGGTEELASAAQVADIAGAAPEFAAGFGTAPVHDGMAARGLGLSGPPTLGTTPSMSMKGLGEFAPSMTGNLMPTAVGSQASMLGEQALSVLADTQLGDFSKLNPPSQYASNNQYRDLGGFGPFMRGGGGWIPMMPRGGLVDPQPLNAPIGRPQQPNIPTGRPQQANIPTGRPQPPNVPMGSLNANVPVGTGRTDPYAVSPVAGAAPTTGGTQDLTPDLSGTDLSALQGGVWGDEPLFGADTDWSSLFDKTLGGTGGTTDPTDPTGAGSTGYGTAIGTQSALTQMGMGHIASDPRLQDYLKDLPQFNQGYQQQFGDIQRGGRQNLAQIYAAQRSGGGGFSGAGAGAQAFGQQYSGLMGQQGAQRRGVVEGFQSDLLSGIRDIEERGDFTFGQGPGGKTHEQVKVDDLMSQGYSEADARRMIYEDAQAGPSFG